MSGEEILIKNTTKVQREKFAKIGLSYSLLGADYPSKETMDLMNEYVEGNMEIADIFNLVVTKYTVKGKKNG